MNARNAVRMAAPGLYQQLARGRNIARLIGAIGRRELDFEMLEDVIKNAKGISEKECSLCGFTGFFKAFGSPPRWDAQCPSCGSLERHRQLALLLQNAPSILDGKKVLHFAPEPCIAALLKKSDIKYTSADLVRVDVDLNLDIENIAQNDEEYDIIVCSHVLEHVNDRRALLELRRILKPDGTIIIMVPIIEGCEISYEDDLIIDSKDRLVHFGQEDHVRVYGADFIQRLTGAGFQVRVHTAFGKEAVQLGLIMGEKIFLCSKADLK